MCVQYSLRLVGSIHRRRVYTRIYVVTLVGLVLVGWARENAGMRAHTTGGHLRDSPAISALPSGRTLAQPPRLTAAIPEPMVDIPAEPFIHLYHTLTSTDLFQHASSLVGIGWENCNDHERASGREMDKLD